jgi:GAF domain-containing protein
MLELFATQGLAQAAVHVTRLSMGQGLVGVIAATREPLNLAEAKEHPDFAYRPETGEDDYHSFAGVPIVRRESAIGVLGVQHREPREYDEVEIEALQTVGMVLAELIHGAGLVDDAQAARARAASSGPLRLAGLRLVDGVGRGVQGLAIDRWRERRDLGADRLGDRARDRGDATHDADEGGPRIRQRRKKEGLRDVRLEEEERLGRARVVRARVAQEVLAREAADGEGVAHVRVPQAAAHHAAHARRHVEQRRRRARARRRDGRRDARGRRAVYEDGAERGGAREEEGEGDGAKRRAAA